MEGALRMVLVGDRSAEQGEDAVARGLRDVPLVAVNRIDHQLKSGIDDRARVLGVETLDQLHRALDVGEEGGDGLALAFKGASRS
jgi:hypothetical protein